MKVKELIAILEEQDPDAAVLIMSQQSWAFEHAVYGVTSRAEIEGNDDDEADATPSRDGRAASDVFVVEGSQLRYGSKTAWEVASR